MPPQYLPSGSHVIIPNNKKTLFNTVLLIGIFLASFVAYIQFTKTPQFQSFYNWSQQNVLIFCLVVFSIKVIGTVYPPLPGGLFTLAAIPIIGWFPAYLIDFFGSMVAGSIDYYLGKKYGLKLISKLFDPTVTKKVQNLKIKPHKEIESIFALRFLLGSAIMEAINYGAGILNIKYKNFLIGSLVAHIAQGVPAYYLSQSIYQGKYGLLSLVLIILNFTIFFKIKGRYFE